jgi:tetratricopeptide (TPR) repeat protein
MPKTAGSAPGGHAYHVLNRAVGRMRLLRMGALVKTSGAPFWAPEWLAAVNAGCLRGQLSAFRLEYQEAESALRWVSEEARDLSAGFQLIFAHFEGGIARGNHGRLSEALSVLREGMRLAELHGERFWLSRLPNTLRWLHRELLDLETAMSLDAESVRQGREFGVVEAEANARVNLGHNYLELGETALAFEHFQGAQRIYNQDIFMQWRYNLRLQTELARYWITQGDLKAASSHTAAALQVAEAMLSRKYIAWAHKLLGDIAALEERVEDGERHYSTALGVLQRHPCQTIEWKILRSAAVLARRQKHDSAGADFLGRARAVVQSLADAIDDHKPRQGFLSAKPVRDLAL